MAPRSIHNPWDMRGRSPPDPRIEVIIRWGLYHHETITIQNLFRYALARRRVRRASLQQDSIRRWLLQVLGRQAPLPLRVTGPAVIKIQQAIRGFIARCRYRKAQWWRRQERHKQKSQRRHEAAKTIQLFIRPRLHSLHITQLLEERIAQGGAARLQLQRFRERKLRFSLLCMVRKKITTGQYPPLTHYGRQYYPSTLPIQLWKR
jgi:hypothetical protein